ncbi:hypothetical protein [Cellulomonas rhizosphaerae]|uniref:Uncharacterized protein n=1 Tax=Cellulomonas rhizosphaerae TaxID=2293719 RepID=A0A413RR40_9CELL|nr:hypothetical protein [Cellulomonas rhizosphaerae]RHA44381.1 hypothetical protein D1825_01550 [Cellulomonas rhizosphaerae]
MGHPPLTFEQVRSRLHARHPHASFTLESARRATPAGLTRTVWLRVTPGSTTRWDLDTRRWSGARVQHRTLDEVEAEASAVLDR